MKQSNQLQCSSSIIFWFLIVGHYFSPLSTKQSTQINNKRGAEGPQKTVTGRERTVKRYHASRYFWPNGFNFSSRREIERDNFILSTNSTQPTTTQTQRRKRRLTFMRVWPTCMVPTIECRVWTHYTSCSWSWCDMVPGSWYDYLGVSSPYHNFFHYLLTSPIIIGDLLSWTNLFWLALDKKW